MHCRVIVAAVKPALDKFTPAQAEVTTVLSDSTLSAGSVLDLCQTLYGVDLILHHTPQRGGGGGDRGVWDRGGGGVGVQLLEIQMEPNTLVKCASELPLYAGLAAGVWQIVTRGQPDDEEVFEKLDF
jgi:hypothetical protein